MAASLRLGAGAGPIWWRQSSIGWAPCVAALRVGLDTSIDLIKASAIAPAASPTFAASTRKKITVLSLKEPKRKNYQDGRCKE
jgi:hypothetical protein